MGTCKIHSCSDCGTKFPEAIILGYKQSIVAASKKIGVVLSVKDITFDEDQYFSKLDLNDDSEQNPFANLFQPEIITKSGKDDQIDFDSLNVNGKLNQINLNVEDEYRNTSPIKEEKLENLSDEPELFEGDPYSDNGNDTQNDSDIDYESKPIKKARIKSIAKPKSEKNIRVLPAETLSHEKMDKSMKKAEIGGNCDHCGKYFNRRRNIKKHVASVHMGIKAPKIDCKVCGLYFSMHNINYHYKNKHLTTKSYAEENLDEVIKEFLKEKEEKEGDGLLPPDSDEIGFKCQLCNKAFRTKKHKNKHVVIEHADDKDQKIKCVVCDKDINILHLVNHFIFHGAQEEDIIWGDGKEPILNPDRIIDLKKALVLKAEKASTRTVQCPDCGKFLSKKDSLNAHRKKVHQGIIPKHETKVPCHMCGKEITQSALAKHIRYTHEKIKQFCCGTCAKPFGKRPELERHMIQMKHYDMGMVTPDGTKNFPVSCAHCSLAFQAFECWMQHSNSAHITIQEVRCGFCGKIFDSTVNLATHLQDAHLMKDTIQPCELCTSNNSQCNRQKIQDSVIQIPPPQPKFACATCEKLFLTKANLERHMKSNNHTGIIYLHKASGRQAFACVFCNKTFETYDCWYLHATQIHNNMYETKCGYCHQKCSAIMSQNSIKDHLLSKHLYQEINESCDSCLSGQSCNRDKEQITPYKSKK